MQRADRTVLLLRHGDVFSKGFLLESLLIKNNESRRALVRFVLPFKTIMPEEEHAINDDQRTILIELSTHHNLTKHTARLANLQLNTLIGGIEAVNELTDNDHVTVCSVHLAAVIGSSGKSEALDSVFCEF